MPKSFFSRLRSKTKKRNRRRTHEENVSSPDAPQSTQPTLVSHKPYAVEQSTSTSSLTDSRVLLSSSTRRRTTQKDFEKKLRSSFDKKEQRKLSLYADPRVQQHVVQDLEKFADGKFADYESTDDEGVEQSPKEENLVERTNQNGASKKPETPGGTNGSKLSEEKDSIDDFDDEDDDFESQIEKVAYAFGEGMQGELPAFRSYSTGDVNDTKSESGSGYGSSTKKTLRPVRLPRKRRTSGSIPNSVFDKKKENHSWQDFSGFHKLEPNTREKSNNVQRNYEQEGSYASVPEIEIEKLPRGGISMETEAVGRVQVI